MDSQGQVEKAVAERRRVETAMRTWRRHIAQDQHAGLRRPEFAFSLASIIDALALDWRKVDPDVRSAVLTVVEQIERDAERYPSPGQG